MDIAEFIRDRIREARKEARLSQAELAELIDSTQSTVSDFERGRVQVNAIHLARIAQVLGKPLVYFFPPGAEAQSEREAELLNRFRSVPERWQHRMLGEVEKLIQLRQRVQPYERAGIPDEFWEHLLWEELEMMEAQKLLQEPEIPQEQIDQWLDRYRQWKADHSPKEE